MSIDRVRQLISDKADKVLGYANSSEFPKPGKDYILYRDESSDIIYFYDHDVDRYIDFRNDNKPDWIFFSDDEIDLQISLDNGNEYAAACSLIPMMIQKLGREMEAVRMDSGVESTTYSSLAERRMAMQKVYELYKAKLSNQDSSGRSINRVLRFAHTPVAGMDECL